MVDLGGYVIIIVETKDKKIKLYGSPADKEDLEVGDEILEVNGRSLENVTHTEVISHIHQCIRSRTICLRVKRRTALDLTTQHNNIQDAFVIAVEQQARERLEKLSQLEKIKPIDMTKLSHQLSEVTTSNELNGLIKEVTGSPIYITSVPELNQQQHRDPTNLSSSSLNLAEWVPPAALLGGDKSKADTESTKSFLSDQEKPLPPISLQPPPAPKSAGVKSTAVETVPISVSKPTIAQKIVEPSVGATAAPPILKSATAAAKSTIVNGHREMAVDVPDTFIHENKTRPVYPPKSAEKVGVAVGAGIKFVETKPIEKPHENDVKALKNETNFESYEKMKNPNIDLPQLISHVQSIQESLNKNGYCDELKSLHQLFQTPEFQKVLQIYNKVFQMNCLSTLPVPVNLHLQQLVQECVANLYNCSAVESMELINLFSKINFENIMIAYDRIAEREKVSANNNEFYGESIDEIITRSVPAEDPVKIVRIEKTTDPLGATVRNEGENVVIGRIIKGGTAEKYGLNEGDEILEVNGIEMKGKSINDVCDVLSHMTGTLTFLIIPNSRLSENRSEIVIHARAQYNYNPKDDVYLPCHELGITFNKGDILHIINQTDLNWWQAHREGEEEQLAGLIPSKLFQEQRELLKQNLNELNYETKKKTSAALLCTKGKRRKKLDSEETIEIPTYEEVQLAKFTITKRPIILIGPPNIGRHELRQRLIQDHPERFAAAVPHTTRPQKENEVNGHDYYFITRQQFEADILASKFIEYGEFEKSYYGTSVDSIKSIITSNKICIINLHPQSIKCVRNSELKPYIIFIAPASLERLKELRVIRGEAYKEDELIEIIANANKMEYKYGHLFDFIIVNNDLELTYYELIQHINYIEFKPQWVPSSWN